MKRAVFVCPGIGGQVAGGGWALYRSVALVLQHLAEEVVVLGPAGPMDGIGGAAVTTSDGVLSCLDMLSPDLIVKAAGSLSPEEDERLDRGLMDTGCDRRTSVVYFDCDAPSRIPMLWYQPSYYLSKLLQEGVPVVLWGGGARAVHGYRSAGADSVYYLRPPLLYCGLAHAIKCWGIESANPCKKVVVSDVSSGDERRERVDQLLADASSCGVGTRVVDQRVDPSRWLSAVADAGMVLNLLRSDVQGFSDLSASRVFEAVACGAVLVSEWYPGIDAVVPEPFRISLPSDLRGWQRLSEISEAELSLKVRGARRYLECGAREAFVHAVSVFGGLTPERSCGSWV